MGFIPNIQKSAGSKTARREFLKTTLLGIGAGAVLLGTDRISKAMTLPNQNTGIAGQKLLPPDMVTAPKLILKDAVEPNLFYNKNTRLYEMAYRYTEKGKPPIGYEQIGYASSKDGETWVKQKTPALKTADGVVTPYVFEKDGTNYMLVKNNKDRAVYLYQSDDKKSWKPAGNEPVILPSSDEKAFDYDIWTPAVVFDRNKAYFYYEAKGVGTGTQPRIGVATADWKNGRFTNVKKSTTPLLSEGETYFGAFGVGNPHSALYVPERNAYMLFLGGVKSSQSLGPNYWTIGVMHADLGSDLTAHDSWKNSAYYLVDDANRHSAGPSVLVKPDGKMAIAYTHDPHIKNNDYWEIMSLNVDKTPVQFYDLISGK